MTRKVKAIKMVRSGRIVGRQMYGGGEKAMMLLFLMKRVTKHRARAIKEKFWGNPK